MPVRTSARLNPIVTTVAAVTSGDKQAKIVTDDKHGVSELMDFLSVREDEWGFADLERERPDLFVQGDDQETGCGIEECCPSLPADIVELADNARRNAVMKKAAKAVSLDISIYDDFLRLNELTTDQLEQVLHLARP